MITSGSNSHKIEKWLGAVVDSAAAPDNGVDLFLYHAGPDEPARLLVSRSLTDAPTREEMNDLVEDIDRQALEDSETQGWNTQRYVLRARDRKNGRELGSVSLKYASNALVGEGGSFADSMPANARGVTGLAMQQADNCQKGLLAGIGMVLEHTNRALQRCDAQAEKMAEALFRSYALHGENSERQMERESLAAARKLEAELKYRKETAQIDRSEYLLREGVEKLGSLVPIIANRFMGNKAGGADATTRDLLVSSLLESLTAEQRDALRGILSDAQMCTVSELDEAVAKVKGPKKAPTAPTADEPDEPLGDEDKRVKQSIEHVELTMLPWALERFQKGESVDPRLRGKEDVRHLRAVLNILAPKDYAFLVGPNSPYGEVGAKAFAAMVETLKKEPASASSPAGPSVAPAKSSNSASKEKP